MARRWWACVAARPRLTAVFVVGAAVRAVLVPITHGPDFDVWDLASRATLNGVNVYAHHPAYSGGPYAYVPLFLDLELPMQWLALHLGIPFTILGKLPIMGGDVLAAALLAGQMRCRSRGDGGQALAAGLFFLNPLVLYNGAFYGRFDSVCIAFLLLAVSRHRPGRPATWGFAVSYALAVAAKTFPVFILPWLLRRGRVTASRVLLACLGVVGGLSAPYLLTSPGAFTADLLYSVDKPAGSLSWQVVFDQLLPGATQVHLSQALLVVFVLAAAGLAWVDDLVSCCAAATLLFIVLSKVVIEQYLTWPLVFLILLALGRSSRSAAVMVVVLTAVGVLVNPYLHPFGREPAVLDVLLAASILVYVAGVVKGRRRPAAASRGLVSSASP